MRYTPLFVLLAFAACTDKDDDTDVDTGTDADSDTALDVFDVTATASGLINGSATVSINGTDVLIEGNGTVTLEDLIVEGETITAQATAPTGQTCAVDAPTTAITDDSAEVTLTCTCDWIPGVEFNTYEADFAINGLGAQLGETDTRGINAAFDATCGGVEHRVLDSTTEIDPPDGSDWTGAVFNTVSRLTAAGESVYAIARVESVLRGGPPTARVLYRASAPDFTPEPLLAQVSGSSDAGRIVSIDEYDVGPDGTVAALVRVELDGSTVDRAILWDGSEWVDGVTIDSDGDTPNLCELRNVVVTGPGEATVLAQSGTPCIDTGGARRGRDTSTYSELVAFDQSGTSRTVLSVGDDLGNGNTLTDIYSTQAGAEDQVLLAIRDCAPDELCDGYTGIAPFDFEGIVRVDLSTDTPTSLLSTQEDVGGLTPISFEDPWVASPTGDVVGFADALDTLCEGRCVIEPTLMRSVAGATEVLRADTRDGLEPSESLLDGGLSIDADGTVVFVSEAYTDLRGRPSASPSVLCWADDLTSAYGPTSTNGLDTALEPIIEVYTAGPGQWAAHGRIARRGFSTDTLIRDVCAN